MLIYCFFNIITTIIYYYSDLWFIINHKIPANNSINSFIIITIILINDNGGQLK
jgi:hypothetical protein